MKKSNLSYAARELNVPQKLLVRFIEKFTGKKDYGSL